MAFNAEQNIREIDGEIKKLTDARNALATLVPGAKSSVRNSGRGGPRPGAGRPKGSGAKRHRGPGRPKGSGKSEGNGQG